MRKSERPNDDDKGVVSGEYPERYLPGVSEPTLERLVEFLRTSTLDLMFLPLAYGVDRKGDRGKLWLLTATVKDYPEARRLVARAVHSKYSKSHPFPSTIKSLPIPLLEKFSLERRMNLKSDVIEGFDSKEEGHLRLVNRLMAFCAATHWTSRAVSLIDVVGFSARSPEEQLAVRMALGRIVNVSIEQCARLLG